MYRYEGKLRILHIILAIRETSAPYNEHCLPYAQERDITICTYFRSDTVPSKSMTIFEGDGSLPGFFRVLKAAVNAKEYDIVHAHSPHVGLLFLLFTLFSFRRHMTSTVITVHDSFQNFKFRNQLMFLPVFASFQRVICCSLASYKSFPVLYKWLAGNRLCYVQNGLDIDRVDRIASNDSSQNGQQGDFTIVAISRLVEIKNPSCILAAVQETVDQNSRLVYMGDGLLRHSLIKRSKEIGLEDQIKFTGLIPRERVFEYLLNADLFISTSRGEGLPVSVLEAMACRCPVLLSDIPPHREIASGVDFIPLVNPEDITGFAREIKNFREMPLSERRIIGQKCRNLVEERFSLTAMHAGYEGIYAQIIGQRVSSPLEMAR